MVFAPLAPTFINGLEHGVEQARGEGGMPEHPAQIRRALFTHLGLAGRLLGLMQLRIYPGERYQLIRIGEALGIPDLGIDGGRSRGTYAGNRKQRAVQRRIAALDFPIQVGDQALQIANVLQQESQFRGPGLSPRQSGRARAVRAVLPAEPWARPPTVRARSRSPAGAAR